MKVENNILIVTSEYPPMPGGIGNHSYHLSKYLHKAGMSVTVLADQRSPDNLENSFDSEQSWVIKRTTLKKWRWLMYFQRVFFYLKLVRTSDIVIATGKFPLWLVGCFSLIYGQRYVAVVHGSEVNLKGPLSRKLVNLALTRFNKVIAVSNYTKGLIHHLNLKSVKVIPNGIDSQFFDIKDLRNISINTCPNLITVGRLSERKGQLHVIRHLPELIKKYPNVHYHCIGIDTDKEVFLKEAECLSIMQYITIHGVLDHQNMKSYLKSSDVFIMLSKETKTGDLEGFGIAILEANALGVPAIGSKGCGIEDAIDESHSGILIDSLDTRGFVDSVKLILEDQDRFSKGAKSWAKRHQWDIIIKQYLEFIEL